jgi:hypothetical protein
MMATTTTQPAPAAPATLPQPGDAVRLDGPYWGAELGAIAIIDSTHYGWDWDTGEPHVMLVFKASAFRGPRSAYSADQTERVSCSGGPCPFVKLADLTPAGERAVTFWRWRDLPRAGGGVEYQRTVPLWSWGGQPRERAA